MQQREPGYDDRPISRRRKFSWHITKRHSGIAMLTPATVHEGHADRVLGARHIAMLAAHAHNPERCINCAPILKALREDAWINRPISNKTQHNYAKEILRSTVPMVLTFSGRSPQRFGHTC
jgi:hypothetical protein